MPIFKWTEDRILHFPKKVREKCNGRINNKEYNSHLGTFFFTTTTVTKYR